MDFDLSASGFEITLALSAASPLGARLGLAIAHLFGALCSSGCARAM